MSCLRPNVPRSDPKDLSQLAEPLRSRFWTMQVDCPGGGLLLISGYRDSGRQWDLRHERCRGRECDRSCKGYPTTAVPGSSNHEKRTALDMGGRGKAWAIANRARYGLGLTVRKEDWHLEASGYDVFSGRRIPNPTARIIPFGGKSDTPQVLRFGAKGDAVKFLQGMLNILWKLRINSKGVAGGRQIAIDGHYGNATVAAVTEFQRFARAMGQLAGTPSRDLIVVDGIAGPATLGAISFWVPLALKG